MAITNKELADLLGTVTVGANHTETLNTAYQAAFGRDADAEGIAYWSNELTNGLSVSNLLEALLNGADAYVENTEYPDNVAKNTADKAVIANKSEVVEYAKTVNLSDAKLTTFLADVTADAATVTTVKSTIDADVANDDTSVVGSTIVFTEGIDALVGTSGDDIFVGDNTLTSSAADQVAGGAGTDTVKIYNDGATALKIPVMQSVENLYVKGYKAGDALDISGLSITSLELDTLDVNGADTTVTFAAGQKVILDSVTDSVSDDNKVILAAKTATVTTADLEIDGVSSATTDGLLIDITGAGVKTLNLAINGSGASNADINNAALKTVNVSGSGAKTNLLDIDASVNLETYDASAATADITVDLSNSTKNITAKGGSGVDTITADLSKDLTIDTGAGDDVVIFTSTTVGDLTSLDSIDGGEGIDTLGLTVNGANAFDDSTKLGQIVNFEQLRITDDAGASGGDTVDVSKFGFNGIQLAAATTTADFTVKGLTSGATLEYRADASSAVAGTVIVQMTGATGAGTNDDTLNIKLNADLDNDDDNNGTTGDADQNDIFLDVAGINILNITANDRDNADAATTAADGYLLDLQNGNDANVTAINVDGTSALAYTVAATAVALDTVDASASSGNMTFDLSAFAGTQGIVYKGSEGIDTVTTSTFADLVTLGAGKDVYTVGTGTSTEAAMDKISDFNISASGDKIDVLSNAIGADHSTAIDVSGADADGGSVEVTAKVKDGIVSLYGADKAVIDTLAEWIDVVETAGVITDTAANAAGDSLGTVAFEFNGNTYVVEMNDANNDDTFDVGTVAVIELTGVTGVESLSTANVADSVFIG